MNRLSKSSICTDSEDSHSLQLVKTGMAIATFTKEQQHDIRINKMKKTSLKKFIQELFAKPKQPRVTKREFEVAGLLASGLTNQGVADKLGISIKTVERHRTALHKKNNLRNTADLTRWALAKGLAENEFLRRKK